MLVLTRREGEALVIDSDIKVTILSVKGSQVRIGIEAPQSVPIHREELLDGGKKREKMAIENNETESQSNS
ncbi:carbon storage regulator CsrA [Thiomicrorhabdus sp. 6S2-11]|jgi:carbon storage regulator|uniref:Translational regulator CsrA n=1 Tax=Thiomicrorhabdus marina TaxID=2818442 RepID=A0ABS3Q7T2_9GAMM|nr:carbon storage regulator CsrA [Thiomicrorhabdus marina]MBO1927880.1 carbon storage regulator CsrA [Thiomicrorhabdus marina]